MSRDWIANGAEYAIEWAGQTWTIRLDDPRPGLRSDAIGPLLGLEGLAAEGRCEPDALSGASLSAHEIRHHRLEATYAPSGWDELSVRAAWSPWGDDAMDLEIQVHTLSVGKLRSVEVRLLSVLGELPPAGSSRSVEPRDAKAAALSYDGRETDLAGLTTGPPVERLSPWLVPRSGRPGWTYIEMVHPGDVSRRIHEGRLPFQATRYELFGCDLEKGVVLRARLRGVWASKTEAYSLAEARFKEFVEEPPPLAT